MKGSPFPTLSCGEILRRKLPDELSRKNPPITLGKVSINPRTVFSPCVLFNYSLNITFVTESVEPIISLVFQLAKTSKRTKKTVILEEWNFKGAEIIPTDVQNMKTIEPIDFNVCDCDEFSGPVLYRMQLAEIITNNASFSIDDEEISAIVVSGKDQ
ncbi:DUF4489 domain-containing protein [Guptibacillus algicola]|uniref:DUF4489 domain-containing protein n=1 Tax=Guptibacillus algicola TaxID=225844 RepID=UPI001CD3120C|nr:DUF4489 domain-containing protein [Alkalihalobacillus algicola]MCA0987454.1 DUF4489 domain-containing protein [Alkalihalobacillus algicola]